MSSFHSLLTNMRAGTERSSGLSLLAGMIIGLVVGLLIGWVFWPVEYAGAYVNELTPSARADYLAAVADSYAYSQSPESLSIAVQRLQPLRASVGSEINAAIEHFRNQASTDSNIRIMNLAQLATSLGVPLDQSSTAALPGDVMAADLAAKPVVVEITATTVDPAASVATANVSTGNVATTNEVAAVNDGSLVEETGFQILPFLLRVLVAMALIAGGLYLFRWLQQQRQAQADGGTTGGWRLPGWNSGGSQASNAMAGRAAQGDDDYEFAAEGDDDEGDPFSRADDPNRKIGWSRNAVGFGASGAGAAVSRRSEERLPSDEQDDGWEEESEEEPYAYQATPRGRTLEDDPYDTNDAYDSSEEYLDDDELENNAIEDDLVDDDDDLDDHLPPSRPQGRVAPDAPATPNQRIINEDRFPSVNDTETRNSSNRSSSFAPPSSLPSTPSPAPAARQRGAEAPAQKTATQKAPDLRIAPGAPGKFAVGGFTGVKPVESFSFHYQFGDFDYSEVHPINDASGKSYIGECGMGVSTKNAILHKNSDEVIALEVWLFDKADDRNLSSQMRVLLSEYADTHYLDAFSKDRNGEVRHFVAQPGTRFQLEGKNLLLNGEIVEAKYSREGIFQSVRVKADILRR